MSTRSKKSKQMLRLVEQWRNSGLTQAEFCRLEGLKVASFAYWVSQAKKQETTSDHPGFIALSKTSLPTDAAEVIFPNGVRVRVPAADMLTIRELIRQW